MISPAGIAAMYRAATRRCPGHAPKFGLRSAPALVEFATWCDKRGIHPERYIQARHEAIGFRIRLPVARLASEKFAATFLAWGDGHQADVASQAAIATTLVPARRAAILAERIRLVSPVAMCVGDSATWMDPGSPTCSICPARSRCGGVDARG